MTAAGPHPAGRAVRAGGAWLAGAIAASGLGALPASALADSLVGCGAPSLEETEGFLRDRGYARLQSPSHLTEAQATNAAWTLMDAYLDVAGRKADRGGEDVGTILELQRRAVPGLFRKVDTDRTRFRLFVRGDDVLTVTQTRDSDGAIRRVCRLALGQGALDVVGAPSLDTQDHPDAPAKGLYRTVTILLEE